MVAFWISYAFDPLTICMLKMEPLRYSRNPKHSSPRDVCAFILHGRREVPETISESTKTSSRVHQRAERETEIQLRTLCCTNSICEGFILSECDACFI
ncbi:hypothetical protein CEXT_291881 [Caerostris extrusa]|uniref:Uncharacterized protein n=1 Tax=Caerostris extrusa TaxID=172846 RepID=A0AAV4WXX0_CAEEX|nr:hypothetical protein CEXT_291881 [Caerostris extrusa]